MTRSPSLLLGVFLLVGAVYAGTASGRIDMIDGQFRFEVAHNLVAAGVAEVRDPELRGGPTAADGRRYSMTQLTTSLVAVPVVAVARALGPESIQREHFFFSLTSGLMVAATCALLLRFYLALGVPPASAVFWTLVFAFATLMFPLATSVFDQAQHGFFLLAACYLGFVGARRDSLVLVGLGGIALALYLSFRELYVTIVPALAIVALAPPGSRAVSGGRSLVRYLTFVGASASGVAVWMVVNYLRVGDPFWSVKAATSVLSPFGNTSTGTLALLVSPGKGLLFYSPASVVAALGVRRLCHREQRLGQAVLAAAIVHLVVFGSLSFVSGDWCWGPRYLVPVLPLVALGFPLFHVSRPRARALVGATLAVSFAIQLLAISLDHHRFFYGRSRRAYFWYGNTGFYFRNSALLARPAELLESLRIGVPPEAVAFRPGPYPGLRTYAVFGDDREPSPPAWMRRYRVFWLPRPWPLWMSTVPHAEQPVSVPLGVSFVIVTGMAGAAALRYGLRAGAAPAGVPGARLGAMGVSGPRTARRR